MSSPLHPAAEIATLGGATMGTTWSVKLSAPARIDLRALHAGIEARLDLVVAQMSTWERDSDISRFNRAEAGQWRGLPREFHTVLSCALDIARRSDGAFDPTIGPLVGLWGFGADAGQQRVPDGTSLRAARMRTGWRRLLLQAEPPRALQAGGLQLDLSAIAKGYAVDLVAAHLRASGIGSALVEVGGELYGYGHKPDGAPWRVLVEAAPDEDDEAGEPRVVDLDAMAIATSGDRWHRFEQAGQRYAHTLDPRSGAPVAHAPAAVSVIADDAMHADAWATALTVMGAQAGFEFAGRHGLAARFVACSSDGIDEHMTEAFRARLAA